MIKLINILKESQEKSFRELTAKQEAKPHAAFVVYRLKNGNIAATTRPADRNQAGRVGLPGGKVDPGESPQDAVRRESKEEGWQIMGGKLELIASKKIDGKNILYYVLKGGWCKKLEDHKERDRGIMPMEVSIDVITRSGFGNDFIKEIF